MMTMTTEAKWSKVATECCICGLTLTDASSIEFGIGPICRKKYHYEDAYPVTPEKVALVRQTMAQHPDIFSPEFVAKVEKALTQETTRKAANFIVYVASAEQGMMAVHCAPLLVHLGYHDLAVRIIERLVPVHIERKNGQIAVASPYSPDFVTRMHGIQGAYFTKKDKKDKKWMMEDNEAKAKKLFEALKTCYPGLVAVGPKGAFIL